MIRYGYGKSRVKNENHEIFGSEVEVRPEIFRLENLMRIFEPAKSSVLFLETWEGKRIANIKVG